MSLLITNARLLDPASGMDETGSLLIEDGNFFNHWEGYALMRLQLCLLGRA